MVSTTGIASKLFQTLMSQNFVLQILIGSSVQKMWGTIRSTQTIVYLALTQTPLGYHVNLFINGVMEFASTDILNMGEWY